MFGFWHRTKNPMQDASSLYRHELSESVWHEKQLYMNRKLPRNSPQCTTKEWRVILSRDAIQQQCALRRATGRNLPELWTLKKVWIDVTFFPCTVPRALRHRQKSLYPLSNYSASAFKEAIIDSGKSSSLNRRNSRLLSWPPGWSRRRDSHSCCRSLATSAKDLFDWRRNELQIGQRKTRTKNIISSIKYPKADLLMHCHLHLFQKPRNKR